MKKTAKSKKKSVKIKNSRSGHRSTSKASRPLSLQTLPSNARGSGLLAKVKQALAGPYTFAPFKFFLLREPPRIAPESGLEGFYFTLQEILRDTPRPDLFPLLPHFFKYLIDLLRSCGWDSGALVEIQEQNPGDPSRQFDDLLALLEKLLASGRAFINRNDKALWIRQAAIYQIYPRAFNLLALRKTLKRPQKSLSGRLLEDFNLQDLPAPFSAVRWTGTYPIGLINMKGIGSPFAISDHRQVSDEVGRHAKVKQTISRLRKDGVQSIFELSPNHTAVDSALLKEDPAIFIHSTTKPENLEGYYEYFHQRSRKTYWIRHGGYLYDQKRYYWNDTLQLDLLNPKARKILIAVTKELVRAYGVTGFRVDMAYQLLNETFKINWGDETPYPADSAIESEFFFELIRSVKAQYPEVGFIAEGFYGWEKLAAVGFDLIYNKNEMPLAGGFYHWGWYNALVRRDVWQINAALKRAQFLIWQRASAGMFTFVGHHDLPAPQRVFGDWCQAAVLLTLMLPCARNWYAGTEAGYEEPCPENQKMITFQKSTAINWQGLNSDFSKFVRETVKLSASLLKKCREPGIIPVAPSSALVGYFLVDDSKPNQAPLALVLANASAETQEFEITLPSSRRRISAKLEPLAGEVILP